MLGTQSSSKYNIYYAYIRGWPDLKFSCAVIGHEVTEGAADIGDPRVGLLRGWTIKEPFSNPTSNNELCDYCNQLGAENQAGGLN